MVEIRIHVETPERPARSRWRRLWLLSAIPAAIALGCWWLTEPLDDPGVSNSFSSGWGPAVAVSNDVKAAVEEQPKAPLVWPETTLSGKAAKTVVLEALMAAAERLNKIDGYTATFVKQERMKGRLGPVQTLSMKVRQRPFAIYLKFLTPTPGKEIVFAEGHHDNKMIAHGGGLSRLLVPRIALAPDHPIALADSRHPVTEAGLANMTTRLILFRKLDLDDPESEITLDRVTDEKGRAWYRSTHKHPKRHEGRPFAEIQVLYDPETFIPMDLKNFDWPEPGHEGELQLAEHYSYESVNFDSGLSALDFDPANPKYSFQRY